MTSKLIVDSIEGRTGKGFLTPDRPAFSVKRITGSGTALSGHITLNTVNFNVGNCWDGTNKFQAPVAGIYFFSLTAFSCDSNASGQDDGAAVKVYIEQDTDSSFGSPTMIATVYAFGTGADIFYPVSISGTASLVANEYVRVNVPTGYIYASTLASNYPPLFTGFLIG